MFSNKIVKTFLILFYKKMFSNPRKRKLKQFEIIFSFLKPEKFSIFVSNQVKNLFCNFSNHEKRF